MLAAIAAWEECVPRYFVKVELHVETDEPRLIRVEIPGRLLDNVARPAGLRVEAANVISINALADGEDEPGVQ
jgi:hypothetical protein